MNKVKVIWGKVSSLIYHNIVSKKILITKQVIINKIRIMKINLLVKY